MTKFIMFQREITGQASCKPQQLPGGGKWRADNMTLRVRNPKMLSQEPKFKESMLRKCRKKKGPTSLES